MFQSNVVNPRPSVTLLCGATQNQILHSNVCQPIASLMWYPPIYVVLYDSSNISDPSRIPGPRKQSHPVFVKFLINGAAQMHVQKMCMWDRFDLLQTLVSFLNVF